MSETLDPVRLVLLVGFVLLSACTDGPVAPNDRAPSPDTAAPDTADGSGTSGSDTDTSETGGEPDTGCPLLGDRELGAAEAKYLGVSGDDAGRQLAVGDLTGDGVDELVVATLYANGGAGGAVVLAAPPAGTASLGEIGRRVAATPEEAESVGRSVAVGDVDGDGIGDLALGAPYDGDGRVWIVAGPIAAAADLAEVGIPLVAAEEGMAGHGADVGDVDGDGVADVLVGAPTGNVGQAGGAYVGYGPITERRSLSDEGVDRIAGAVEASLTGRWVRARADLDADGVNDLVLAAPHADVTAPWSGAVYVVYGPPGGDRDLGTDADARITGEVPNEYLGSVIETGDLDGDGRDDLLLGSHGKGGGRGEAVVVLGPAEGDRDATEGDLVVEGEADGQYAGAALAVVDLDGNGRGELVVGGSGESTNGRGAGAAWLFCAPGPGTWSVADAEATLLGERPGDAAGTALASGDVDGDGRTLLFVGAPGETAGGGGAGAVYAVEGE